ncbi:MAG: NUDIX domain-containing protein [Maricaulaceae bacterium]|nr:NUDIX domain-containing protein [Maricaulaceae bacterium]
MSWRHRVEPALRPLFQLWWRRARGLTLGVRGIVQDGRGRVALVRHTYISGWHLPGGGVEKNETVQAALARELAEEAGVALTAPARLFGVYANHAYFRGDHVLVFHALDWAPCQACWGGEIEAADWFDPASPPEGASPGTRRRLAELVSGGARADDW